jgi:hypothetical protein
MTGLLLFGLASGCWLGIGWSVDRWDLYPEEWLAAAVAALALWVAALLELVGGRR